VPVQISPRGFAGPPPPGREHSAPARARWLQSRGRSLVIGLVNNMPDAALESTQRQFVELLDRASRDIAVELRLFFLPDVPRGGAARLHLNQAYLGLDELWRSRLDGLIVTGTEPRAACLRDEPYWGSLTRVLEWAERHTTSTIWSCLAAHAAVLHMDGVERRTLGEKRFGVFACTNASPHPLLAGIADGISIAHSRWNELPQESLTSAGYTMLTRSIEAGVDTFVKTPTLPSPASGGGKGRGHQRSLFVFFQGHPEYDRRALLREYRRDIGRFLRGERQTYPALPHGYFHAEAEDVLCAFRARAQRERSESLLDGFPGSFLETRLAPVSTEGVSRLYRNWLSYLCGGKRKAATLSEEAGHARREDRAAAERVV
jgi:homoserine O-succinyltransferase